MARLPQPGGDKNVWGNVLNDFLEQSHNLDGTVKAGVITTAQIQDGSVGQAKLSATGATSGQVLSTDGSGLLWATPSGAAPDATTLNKGIVQLAGDLGGTATVPTVPGLATKEPVITGGTTTQYYRGDKTFQTLDKATVGLANVTNTSDTAKPVSTAQQTALDLKANLAGGTFSGAISVPDGLYDATAWDGSVEVPTKNAIRDKIESLAVGGVSSVNSQTGAVVLNQDNIADGITYRQYSATEKTKLAGIATGATANSADATLLARANHTGSQTLSTISDVTASATELNYSGGVTSSIQTQLNTKAPLASPTFTGTVTIPTGASITAPTGLVKADVGLGNVDNTSDANKPVSTATQTALDTLTPKIGTTATVVKSGGSYGTRPTGYANVKFIGDTDPGVLALNGDEWVRLV